MPIEARYPNTIKVMIPLFKHDELYEFEKIVVKVFGTDAKHELKLNYMFCGRLSKQEFINFYGHLRNNCTKDGLSINQVYWSNGQDSNVR